MLSVGFDPVIEIGPGYSSLPAVREEPPGSGPLAALAAGAAELSRRRHVGSTMVLCVDLPFVEAPLLELLAARTGDGVAVPIAAGRRQPCCARYGRSALEAVAALVGKGERSLKALLAATNVIEVPEEEWQTVAPSYALDDLDTPEDLARFGFAPER